MNGTQRKQYEMLQRVREFGSTYREVLSTSAVAKELFGAVDQVIDELSTADIKKLSASAAARGDDKANARRGLVELLQKGSQLARVLRAEGRDMPLCDLPASKSDQVLLTAGRQLANVANAFAAEFGGHGMAASQIADVTAAFETAASRQGAGRADHIAATTRIQGLLATAQRQMRRLDLIVANLLNEDTVARTLWKQARRIQEVRGARGRVDAETTTSTAPDIPTPTASVGAAAAPA